MDGIKRRDVLAMGAAMMGALATDGLQVSAQSVAGKGRAELGNAMSLTAQGGALNFRLGWCRIPDWRMALEADGSLLKSGDAKFDVVQRTPLHMRLRFPKQKLVWEIWASEDPSSNRVLLRSTIQNHSSSGIRLGKAFLIRTAAIEGFMDAGDSAVYLPMSTGQQLNQVLSLGASAATSDITIQAFNQSQGKALQVGFISFLRAKTQVKHLVNGSGGLQLDAWCEFDGWELPAGESTPTETLTVAAGADPHVQLEAWAATAAALCQPRPREWEEQAHGWLGWSWVDQFHVERYEDVALRNAKFIQARLSGFGIDYLWVSIGNLKDGQPGAWLDWNTRNFPDGHRFLHDELDQMGMKLGLWCGAFLLSSRLKNTVSRLEDALVKQPDGKQPAIYRKDWAYVDDPAEDWKKPIYALDPSHPKTIEFLTEVFRTYREWGVRYYMVDFLWAGSDTLGKMPHARHYDKTLVSGPEVFRNGIKAIRDACGDDTHLLGATGPTYQCAGVMDAMRVGNDFGEGRPLVAGFSNYPATYVLKPASAWNGPVWALTNQASTYHVHRKLYIANSGNVLTVDKPLQMNQAQINATIHAMSGAASMLGDDITMVDDDRLSLIKKTLPRPLDVAVPVDLFTRKTKGYPRVYHRKIVKPDTSYDVVAVYNLDPDKPISQTVTLQSIGLPGAKHYHVWEFWNSEYVGNIHGQLMVEIPPYTVRVYRLTEDNSKPAVLGTDMHILMGELEIDRCDWDPDKKIHSGRAIRPAGEKGNLYIYAPPSMGVVDPRGYAVGKDLKSGRLVIRKPLDFSNGSAEWKLQFYELASSPVFKSLF